jgi:MFS family permease
LEALNVLGALMNTNKLTATNRDRNLIRLVFFLQPIVLGAWFPRIAEMQAQLGLSHTELSIALIGMPCGLIISLFVSSHLADYFGAKALLSVSIIAFIITMPFAGYVNSQRQLFIALFTVGVILASVELGMNVMADCIENAGERLIMSGCHGFWSLGVLFGSIIGISFAYINIQPGLSLAIVALGIIIPAAIASRSLPNSHSLAQATNETTKNNNPSSTDISKNEKADWSVFSVCLFTFGITFCEGAMADWSSVFLATQFQATAGLDGLGYVTFALAITVGRFSGDWINENFEPSRTAIILVLLAALGLLILTRSSTLPIALIGIAFIGIGLSSGFPLGVSVVAKRKGRSPAANVGLLSQIALTGFLLSPPIIGIISDQQGLRIGLSSLYLALLLSIIMAKYLHKKYQL